MEVRTTILPEAKRAALDVLQDALTEENTDRVLDLLFFSLRLPWWIPAAIARRVLDGLLPEVLLGAIEKVLGEADPPPAAADPPASAPI